MLQIWILCGYLLRLSGWIVKIIQKAYISNTCKREYLVKLCSHVQLFFLPATLHSVQVWWWWKLSHQLNYRKLFFMLETLFILGECIVPHKEAGGQEIFFYIYRLNIWFSLVNQWWCLQSGWMVQRVGIMWLNAALHGRNYNREV